MKKIVFYICFSLFFITGYQPYAQAKDMRESSSPNHMSEILNLLSGGAAKKLPKEEQKAPSPLKTSDIKTTVDLLQNKK